MREVDKADPHRELIRNSVKKALAATKLQNEKLLEEFKLETVEAFGGPKGLAKAFFQEYIDAPDGGSVRASLLKDLTRLLKDDSKSEAKDVGDLSDEELEDATLPLVAKGLESDDE